jgi:integrase
MKIYLLKRRGQLSKENEQKGRVRKISLYLMYHFGANQKREYEFLDLFLYDKPKNQNEKDHNKQTLQLAETIKAKKTIESQTTAHGFISKVKSKICFVAFFKTLVDKKDSTGNYGNWLSAYRHLLKYSQGKIIPLETVDDRFLEGFKEYLLLYAKKRGNVNQRLNRNSASSYFNKIRAALREAFQQKMILENPAMRIKTIKGQDSHRAYLTIEELQILAKANCKVPVLKQLLLASAVTGLRYSDLKNLKWGDIKYSESDGYFLQYTQKKTGKAEILPVSEHVIKMFGTRKDQIDKVFEELKYSAYNNKILKEFVRENGINKDISLHCGRHSYASLQISLGTDIFTVSKMLGHSSIKTTQIYTKLLDKNKIEAAAKIPELFFNN